MRYTLLLFIILLSQISKAQLSSNWIIEADSGNTVFIGKGIASLGNDSLQLITDTSIVKLSVNRIEKIIYDRPSKSGLLQGLIVGVATGALCAKAFADNNKDNSELQSEDKFVATVFVGHIGLVLGGMAGFFIFNRWHKHRTYHFEGLTPAQKVIKLRDIWIDHQIKMN